MKIKTSELVGNALDWAVATANGEDISEGLTDDERYSTNWAQGGPIKSANRISTEIKHDGWWVACIYDLNDDRTFIHLDHDELVAAMRCYVASKLGDEVEIPGELA